jgi:hypothetical protein
MIRRPYYLSFLAVLALVEDESVVQNSAAPSRCYQGFRHRLCKYETNLVSFRVTAMVRTQIKTGLWLVVSTADF